MMGSSYLGKIGQTDRVVLEIQRERERWMDTEKGRERWMDGRIDTERDGWMDV